MALLHPPTPGPCGGPAQVDRAAGPRRRPGESNHPGPTRTRRVPPARLPIPRRGPAGSRPPPRTGRCHAGSDRTCRHRLARGGGRSQDVRRDEGLGRAIQGPTDPRSAAPAVDRGTAGSRRGRRSGRLVGTHPGHDHGADGSPLQRHDPLRPDRPARKEADEGTSARIVEAAHRYVLARCPSPDRWFFQERTSYRPDEAGFKALRLLHDQAPDRFEALGPDVWARWTSPIIGYPRSGLRDDEEAQRRLAGHAYRKAPGEFLDRLARWLEEQGRREHPHVSARLWADLPGSAATGILLDRVRDPPTSPWVMEPLLADLLAGDIPEAREFAASLVVPPCPAGSPRARSIAGRRQVAAELRAGRGVACPLAGPPGGSRLRSGSRRLDQREDGSGERGPIPGPDVRGPRGRPLRLDRPAAPPP